MNRKREPPKISLGLEPVVRIRKLGPLDRVPVGSAMVVNHCWLLGLVV